MAFVRCEFCLRPIRQRYIKVHEKTCSKARRAAKLKNNKSITQSLEYRQNLLEKFVTTQEYDLKSLTDIQFNDLIDRLTVLKKQREEKEKELSDKAKEKKLKAEELEKLKGKKAEELEAKKEKEEKDRLEQIESEKKREANLKEKRDTIKKSFRKPSPPPKTEDEKTEDDIEKLAKVAEKSLDKVKKKPVKKKSKKKSKK